MWIREHLLRQLRRIVTQHHWSELAESASIAGSAVGTVAAAFLQQAAYAAAPITVALVLNFINQKRRDEQYRQQLPSLLAEIDLRFSDLKPPVCPHPQPQPIEINLKEIYDDLAKVNKSLTIIEGKAAFMTSKVYDRLTAQIDGVREQIAAFSEPFDLTRIEAKLASLNVAVQFLAQRPQVDLQEFEKLHRQVLQLEGDRRDLIFPYLQRLEREIQQLYQTDASVTRKIDAINQKFIARPEVAQVYKLNRMVVRLSDSVNQIQHTEAIAALYEDIAQISQEITELKQYLNQRSEASPIREIRSSP